MNAETEAARAALGVPVRPHAPSVWASSGMPAPAMPALDRDVDTDVAIIGAGFTGLNAAWELVQRGVPCVVIDATDAGWGASGRNGGMAVLRYKKSWSALAGRLGDAAALALYRWIHEAVDGLERNVQDLGIDCEFKRYGHITAANGPRALAELERDCAWLASRANDRVPKAMDALGARQLIGTDAYYGAYLDPRSAGIHPLNYARGFAKALLARGVPMYGETPASALRVEAGNVKVLTPNGTITAKHVLVCTNGYTDLFGFQQNIARRVVPVSTSVVTTGPLSPELRATILPQGHLVTDTRHLVNYFRSVPGNRLLFGGRGSLSGRESPEIYEGLIGHLHRTFPALRGTAIDHRWSGMVAVTMDDFPHLGAVGDRVFFALGYGGRGVALTNLLGKHIARYALGQRAALGPMSEPAFLPIPMHGLRIPAMNVVASYYKLRDRLRL
ncbi:MAG: FAD-binding oxidoreductase [Casimicrobiaceae bacterium]